MKKFIKEDGNLKFRKVDYDFIVKKRDEFKEKNKDNKAAVLNKLLAKLDNEKKKGNEIDSDFIEKCVNAMIDANRKKVKEFRKLKEKKDLIRKLNFENQTLGFFSKRQTLLLLSSFNLLID